MVRTPTCVVKWHIFVVNLWNLSVDYVRYYALTDSLYVLKLIGSDCTAFGIDCITYLCNVSFRYVRVQVWYEYIIDTSSVHRPAFSWECGVRRLPFLGCDNYDLYLAGLLHWPQDGVTVQVSLCLFGVHDVKLKKKKIRYYICLLYTSPSPRD